MQVGTFLTHHRIILTYTTIRTYKL